ncbi:farnesyl diphosphate synthase [Crenobacter intestini]|uniref:Geranyl transferase n=1 Tax=Crenobacter intestini TaxID=2563443 RepID=A0A4V4N8A8_9NEIS|nr:geranyl transferase [Crenobacter intestini]
MPADTFTGWMTAIQQQTEQTLAALLPAEGAHPRALHEAMRYSTLGGGKRVRPLLVFAAGEAAGGAPETLAPLAAAVECVHVYSLIHDDLPCMDDDVLRRGKPTCHVAYGEATALLAGDALQTLAFDIVSRPLAGVAPARQLMMAGTLARAAGHAGMAGGQAIDLAAVGQSLELPELEYMHLMKTGALIRASVGLGALAGDIDDEARACLDHFAKCMGLAFQVVDDVLDVDADSQALGKTAGKDAAHDKPTYVSLLGLARAREFARELYDDAIRAVEPFGADARRLRELADYIVERSF